MRWYEIGNCTGHRFHIVKNMDVKAIGTHKVMIIFIIQTKNI